MSFPRRLSLRAQRSNLVQGAHSRPDCFVAAAPRNDKRVVGALFCPLERSRRMSKRLSEAEVARYQRDGFLFPVDAFSPETRLSAMLVRGVDRYRRFDDEPPTADRLRPGRARFPCRGGSPLP